VGALESVSLFLNYGADANHTTSEGETPFTWACCYDHLEVAKFLHEAGANINHVFPEGTTPMGFLALLYGKWSFWGLCEGFYYFA
jgi:ankyrin repeat protein